MASLEQLGAFVAGYRPDDAARAAVRLHVADTIGAWIAALGTAEGRALAAHRKAGLLGHVATHCALARLSEIDDIHLGAMITPGAIVVPTALTIATMEPGVDADTLMAAIAVGYEAIIRLGVAIDGPSVLYRGIWPSYFAAPFGAAAVAARLMRLDEAQTAHALANAFITLSPGTGHHAAVTTARWLAVGQGATRGVEAAQSAQAGFTSDLKLLDGSFLKDIYGITANPTLLGSGVGGLALDQVSFKPWCAARQTMAATQALKELMAEGVAPDRIARIGVAVLPPHLKMINHGVTAGDRFSHLTSVSYQMALAALSPDEAYGITPGPVAPAIAAFMGRIVVRPEEALLKSGYPQAWAAHISVATDSGRHERTVTQVPGDPARPFGEPELLQKFSRVTAAMLSPEQAETMFDAALDAAEHPGEVLGAIEAIRSSAC